MQLALLQFLLTIHATFQNWTLRPLSLKNCYKTCCNIEGKKAQLDGNWKGTHGGKRWRSFLPIVAIKKKNWTPMGPLSLVGSHNGWFEEENRKLLASGPEERCSTLRRACTSRLCKCKSKPAWMFCFLDHIQWGLWREDGRSFYEQREKVLSASLECIHPGQGNYGAENSRNSERPLKCSWIKLA